MSLKFNNILNVAEQKSKNEFRQGANTFFTELELNATHQRDVYFRYFFCKHQVIIVVAIIK